MTPRKQTAMRLPQGTMDKLDKLAHKEGCNRTEAVMIAIDRMYREEFPPQKEEKGI